MLALSAGLIFFTCAFLGGVPRGVTVNGIDVGGMSRAKAAEAVRQNIEGDLKQKSLTVHGRKSNYVFTFPEIYYRDNLQEILKSAKRGGSYTATINYYLCGLGELTENICADESVPAVQPYAVFNTEGDPFDYFEGSDGVKADRAKLLSDIRASLSDGFGDVYIKTDTVKRTQTLNEVKYNTRRLSSFVTYFDAGNEARSHNIALAAQSINGTVLENGDEFSFNEIVGPRTEERGYRTAKIIENGEFVEGTGGGVCQVSTTLFNAAIRAGCEMTEFHPHSLAVSYVSPSSDAMVSGTYFDLKFENKTGYTLYIRARTGKSYVAFDIYGRGDGAKYEFTSVVTGSIAAPEEFTTESEKVKEGRDGILSEGYLTITRNGISKQVLFRRDKYSPIKKITLEAAEEETTEQEETERFPPFFVCVFNFFML